MLLLAGFWLGAGKVCANEPVFTTLADFEDDSVAFSIGAAENVTVADCAAGMASIPARGQRSLMIDVGATERRASIACDLRFRLATPFDQADRVATHAWIKRGSVDLQFRVRDADGRVFESPPQTLTATNRWVRLVADLSAKALQLVDPPLAPGQATAASPTWPVQIQGYRVRAHGIGRQTVYVDDLEVEHRVSGSGVLRGEFLLDNPTHIYEPGVPVRAAVQLENISRQRALPLSVQMAWRRADGSELNTTRASVNLPASGVDYRSRQPVDFSQRIYEPGLYRLIARVQGPGWVMPALETTIAVTLTNRALPRGRATFFGVRTNLLREPPADQLLEVDIADEIGVQLLAIETPWHLLEPSRGAYDFQSLDRLLNRITRRDIATLIVLTEPPVWLADDTDCWNSQVTLFEALARHYGDRISLVQPVLPTSRRDGNLSTTDFEELAKVRAAVAQIRPDIELLAPPWVIRDGARNDFALPASVGAGVQLAFETAGDSAAALEALASFAEQKNLKWDRMHRWLHRSEPLANSGALYDAVAVLRHYVRAAKEGVDGVLWFDLRDDTNDPRHALSMQGLVQRDFSPKTPLLGFANAVGMLHGLRYAGELPGTPEQYESSLFIGGNRQVAVLFPKPNRVLPAVLAPYQAVEGLLGVFDFDRREQTLTFYEHTALTPTQPSLVFITLDAQRAQTQSKIGLARPWLRLPATVYCGKETTFQIEIDAPGDLRRSYLQLVLPPNAPITSSLSSRTLRANAGETLTFDVTLTRTSDGPFEPVGAAIRLRLEGSTLLFPLTLASLADVRPLEGSTEISAARYAIGTLTPVRREGGQDPARDRVAVHADYEKHNLHLAIALPPDADPRAALQLGVALENADTHAEARIENLTDRPRLSPAPGTSSLQMRGWRGRLIDAERPSPRWCHVTIPARSLELSELQPGLRLLVAVRYVEPLPADWTIPKEMEWGDGLAGSRSTAGYNWIRLAHPEATE